MGHTSSLLPIASLFGVGGRHGVLIIILLTWPALFPCPQNSQVVLRYLAAPLFGRSGYVHGR